MKRLVIYFLAVFLSGDALLACDCVWGISKQESYERSEIILLGKIVGVHKGNYTVKVLECYKGDIQDTLLYIDANNDCSIYAELNETWLLYADKIGKNNLKVSSCLWSRSFEHPTHQPSLPPPPSHLSAREMEVYDILYSLSKQQAMLDLQVDVSNFRNNRLRKECSTLSEENTTLRRWGYGISILIVFQLLVTIVFLFRKNSKRIENPTP